MEILYLVQLVIKVQRHQGDLVVEQHGLHQLLEVMEQLVRVMVVEMQLLLLLIILLVVVVEQGLLEVITDL